MSTSASPRQQDQGAPRSPVALALVSLSNRQGSENRVGKAGSQVGRMVGLFEAGSASNAAREGKGRDAVGTVAALDLRHGKHVRFAGTHQTAAASMSAHARASRSPADVKSLDAIRTLLRYGDAVPAAHAQRALLTVLALNDELGFLSTESEQTLARGIERAGAARGQWHPDDAGYQLLDATLEMMEQALRR